MRIQVPSSIPFTVETRIAPGGISGAARRITSRTPWLGTEQITSSRPASASRRSEVARTLAGMRDVGEVLGVAVLAVDGVGERRIARPDRDVVLARAQHREAGSEASGSEHCDGDRHARECINKTRFLVASVS